MHLHGPSEIELFAQRHCSDPAKAQQWVMNGLSQPAGRLFSYDHSVCHSTIYQYGHMHCPDYTHGWLGALELSISCRLSRYGLDAAVVEPRVLLAHLSRDPIHKHPARGQVTRLRAVMITVPCAYVRDLLSNPAHVCVTGRRVAVAGFAPCGCKRWGRAPLVVGAGPGAHRPRGLAALGQLGRP